MSSQTPKVEIELPQEQQTPLPEQERSTVLDPHSGEEASVPAKEPEFTGRHILVCLDPEAQGGQSDVALAAAKKTIKAGDVVILFSVISPMA